MYDCFDGRSSRQDGLCDKLELEVYQIILSDNKARQIHSDLAKFRVREAKLANER